MTEPPQRGRPILAFDTSSGLGSAVVADGQGVRARSFLENPRRHASGLLPAIDALLAEAETDLDGLAGIVVGSGPGSFTGVRVAAATAKGLAFASALPLWTYSSLLAAAASLGARLPHGWSPPGAGPPSHRLATAGPGAPLYVLFDARADRVYGGCWRIEPTAVEALVAPMAGRIHDVLESEVPPGTVFAGDGATRHAWAIEQAGWTVAAAPAGVPTAEGLARLVQLVPTDPVGDVRAWEPEYLRAWSGSAEARP